MRLIAFICRGNTCRSPLAEALARRAFGSDDIKVTSAGVAVDRIGAPADPRAVRVAKGNGLDLGAHRAAALTADLVSRADLLVALDTRTRDDITARFDLDRNDVRLLLSFAPDASSTDVADPYDGNDGDYEAAFDLISRGIEGLRRSLR